MKKRKLLAIVLALAMTLSLLPVTALAEGEDTGEDAEQALQAAITAGGTVTVTSNITLTKPLIVNNTVTLNLGGYTISNTGDIWKDTQNDESQWSLISVRGGSLTINGSGTLQAKENDCYAIDIQDGGSCTINGGTYDGNVHAVYVFKGTLTVNGGEFSVQQKFSNERPDEYVLNCYDSNYNSGAAQITVTGGTFHGFNPGNCYAEGANTSFLADGYQTDTTTADNANRTVYTVKAAPIKAETSTENDTVTATVSGAVIPENNSGDDNVEVEQQTFIADVTTANNTAPKTDVKVGAAAMQAINEASNIGTVELKTNQGTISLNGTAWNQITSNANGNDATISISVTKETSTNNTLVTVTAVSDSTEVYSEENADGKVTLAISFDTALETIPVVYYAGKNGLETMAVRADDRTTSGGKYYLVWDVEHFSDYIIMTSADGAVATAIDTTGKAATYSTLQEAITAAKSGTTVTLLKDTTENVTVAEGQNITLDLNGKTLSGGTDKVDGKETEHKDKAAITNNGVIIIKDSSNPSTGTIKRDDVKVAGDSYYVIDNQGTMTIESGTVTNDSGVNGAGSSLIRNAGAGKAATLNITGGTFQQNNFIVIKNDEQGTLNITGGTINSANDQAIQNWSKATVSGGEMNGAVYSWSYSVEKNGSTTNSVGEMEISGTAKITGNVYAVQYKNGDTDAQEPAKVTITGGTVIGRVGAAYSGGVPETSAELTVSNGNFSNPVNEKYLSDTLKAELYSTDKNPEAPYSYYTDVAVAQEVAGPNDIIKDLSVEVDNTKTYCTVTVDYDDGASAKEVYQVELTDGAGTYTISSTAPTRSGYTFLYWTDGSKNYKAGDTVNVSTTDVTLTARWTVIPTPSTGGSSSGGSSTPTYSVTAPKADNGTVTVSPKNARKGAEVTITVKPDAGYEVDEVIVTDKNGKTIKVTEGRNGKYTFTMPASKVEVEVTFVKEYVAPAVSFDDVSKGAWYYDAAIYAAENGIMSGTGGNNFSPDMTTSRAMIWTILARLDGQNVSVTYGNWYDKAQMWAMTNRVSDGTNPNGSITREQLAVMLYSYAQADGYTGKAGVSLSRYLDASDTSAWAVEAMEWAVGNGLISSTGGNLLSPTATATRAQVAVILMNFCENLVK